MTAMRRSLLMRVVATAGVIALGVSGLVGGGAFAAPGPGAHYGNIDQSGTGSITVHKRESGSQGDQVGTVAEAKEGIGVGVKGVTFKAYKLTDFDPQREADWNKISKLKVAEDACGAKFQSPTLAGYQLDGGKEFSVTDGDGVGRVADLSVGAYLICEHDAPKTVLKRSLPFVVTIPFSDSVTKGWVYDVHAYPKNTVVTAPVKAHAIGSNGLNTDEDFTFTIEAKVPSLAKKEHFKFFTIADPLIKEFKNISVESVTVAGVPVRKGGDHEYQVNDPNLEDQKNTVIVNFTRKGLESLKAQPNAKVVVTIKAKLESLPDQGEARNKGYLYVDTTVENTPPVTEPPSPVTPNEPGVPPTEPPGVPPATPSNEVASRWGQLKIRKVDSANTNTPLEGAVFKVYLAKKQGVDNSGCTSTETTGSAISVGGKSEFSSQKDGIVDIAGLLIEKVSATNKDAVDFTADHRCYVIEEVNAPVGYALPTVTKTGVRVTPGVTAEKDVQIENSKVTVPELPLTGASGQVLMLIGGTSLIMFALGVGLINRRRSAQR